MKSLALLVAAVAVYWWGLLAACAADPARIEWDKRTLTLVEQGAGYGRMIRMKNGHVMCCFEKRGQIWVKDSSDDGKSWPTSAVLVAKSDFGRATNPELLELLDGSVMCCFNERPNDGIHPFAILACTTSDGGKTWSSSQRIYEADTKFENGCWEPSAIQLPDGEIQLYFANESPYRTSNEQEISMVRSVDNGRLWQKPTTISFRSGHRDGMPVPLLLSDNPQGIVVAIEDNGIAASFLPVIVYSPLLNNWRDGPVSGDSPHRWAALNNPPRLGQLSGAPYIRQMPSGETVLSFQCTESGRSKPHMVVCVGDSSCRNFGGRSVPFEVGEAVPCLWNSLFVKSTDVVTAVSGTTIQGVRGLWCVDGRLIRDVATRLK